MSLPVSFRPRARRDVLDQMLYLEEQAGEEVAFRYHEAVWATCQLLAGQPLAGKRFVSAIPTLAQLRRFPVCGPFEHYLIFYQPAQDTIEVVRVIHGARDIEALFADEPAD